MIKISITGPESTGKSWLAKKLASHYHTLWVPEYAREYLQTIDRPYSYDDILLIAQKQSELEDMAATKTELLFCDTDFSVAYVWCTVKYSKCHNWIAEKVNANLYSLFLLCDVDLPWQYDPLRENPDNRSELFVIYENLMVKNNCNYRIINGKGKTRLQNAINAVDELLKAIQK